MTWLAKVALRSDPSAKALLSMFPRDPCALGHKLVWLLFADDPDARRDFLWREVDPGSWVVLSRRKPADEHNLFDMEGPCPFAPKFDAGDETRFNLRANPAVWKNGRKGGRKHDVVADAMLSAPKTDDPNVLRKKSLMSWLADLGGWGGFRVDPSNMSARRHRRRTVPRGNGNPACFTTVDYDGALTIKDPERFRSVLQRGIGPSKAWGCGLMLIGGQPWFPETG